MCYFTSYLKKVIWLRNSMGNTVHQNIDGLEIDIIKHNTFL